MDYIKSIVKLENVDKVKLMKFIENWKKIKDLPTDKINIQELDNRTLILELYYPLDLFDHTVTQFMTVLFGELSSTEVFGKITFLDLELPNEVYKWFNGPKFGPKEIKKRFEIRDYPLLIAIIKPSLGKELTSADVKNKIESVLEGGFHGIKDDEMQGNLSYSPLKDRMNFAKKYKKYIPALNRDILEDYKSFLGNKKSENIGMVIINASTLGFSMLHEIRKITKVPILSHLALQGIYCSNFSPKLFAKLHRLFGCDAFTVPIANVGYFNISEEGQKEIVEEFTKDLPIKETLPIFCGGARLNNLDYIMKPSEINRTPYGIMFGTLIFNSEGTPAEMCKKVLKEIDKIKHSKV